jgi:N-methylhydantoinase A
VQQTTNPTLRVGVDVGGTFTDVIAWNDSDGSVAHSKRATSSAHPAEGVLRALEQAAGSMPLTGIQRFVHGTTVALNAILEQRGAIVGLLCTAGFRDVLELRRGTRDDAFNLLWEPPPALVPRHLRLPVRERMLADGSVRHPLVEEDVEAALAVFGQEQVEVIAVAFINSWANPAHERQAGEVLRRLGFAGEMTLSHELTREYREFERTSTVVVNAYVQPRISGYLRDLAAGLAERGVAAELHLMRSGGGTMSFGEAEQRPFEAIASGPVAGAEAAAHLARALDLEAAISADVGGTSFDTCLVLGGRTPLLNAGYVGGLPVQSSWVDVRAIGAGGGSIVRLDRGGLLRVGPESAGSHPGPAAYGRGGEQPTVTDAALVLGMLGEGELSGEVSLRGELARRALAPLAQTLGSSVEEVARGVLLISAAAMANAIREITIEKGHDPRDAALVAFGGAGPMFATLLARELDITRIVIPPLPGNFSAWGLLEADLTREAARTFLGPLCDETLLDAERAWAELYSGLSLAVSDGVEQLRLVDLRYRGQEHTLSIPLEGGNGRSPARAVSETFRRRYRGTYSHELDEELEVVGLRLRAQQRSQPLPWPTLPAVPAARTAATRHGYSFTREGFATFALVARPALSSSEVLAGPAILTEDTATTYLDSGFHARVHPSGCLLIEAAEAP